MRETATATARPRTNRCVEFIQAQNTAATLTHACSGNGGANARHSARETRTRTHGHSTLDSEARNRTRRLATTD